MAAILVLPIENLIINFAFEYPFCHSCYIRVGAKVLKNNESDKQIEEKSAFPRNLFAGFSAFPRNLFALYS